MTGTDRLQRYGTCPEHGKVVRVLYVPRESQWHCWYCYTVASVQPDSTVQTAVCTVCTVAYHSLRTEGQVRCPHCLRSWDQTLIQEDTGMITTDGRVQLSLQEGRGMYNLDEVRTVSGRQSIETLSGQISVWIGYTQGIMNRGNVSRAMLDDCINILDAITVAADILVDRLDMESDSGIPSWLCGTPDPLVQRVRDLEYAYQTARTDYDSLYQRYCAVPSSTHGTAVRMALQSMLQIGQEVETARYDLDNARTMDSDTFLSLYTVHSRLSACESAVDRVEPDTWNPYFEARNLRSDARYDYDRVLCAVQLQVPSVLCDLYDRLVRTGRVEHDATVRGQDTVSAVLRYRVRELRTEFIRALVAYRNRDTDE
jgi:hypothetical protein